MDAATRPRKQEQEPAVADITEVAPSVLRLQLPIEMPGLGHVNCYALLDGRGAALVDPGLPGEASWQALVARLATAGIPLRRVHTVVVTHSHPDHFGGAARLRAETDAEIVTHRAFRMWWNVADPDGEDPETAPAMVRPPQRPWDGGTFKPPNDSVTEAIRGHLQALLDPDDRARRTKAAMGVLVEAAEVVGGDILSGGGTGTWQCNPWVTELQAGSYALMDTAYAAAPDVPFEHALSVLATVISVRGGQGGWAVADAGLKAFGMDHGKPSLPGAEVQYCADEHTVFVPPEGTAAAVGDRVRLLPAHIDPTVAYHDTLWLVDGDEVVESWPVDLRGW